MREFLLSRSANARGSRPVLVLAPAVDQPVLSSTARLENVYKLWNVLDPSGRHGL
jgi:hypothetical protein